MRYTPTKSHHFVFYLSECFVHASVCASVQLEKHSPGNTNKIIDVLLDFSLTVKAATLIFISGRGSVISSVKEGKSGFIYNLIKSS